MTARRRCRNRKVSNTLTNRLLQIIYCPHSSFSTFSFSFSFSLLSRSVLLARKSAQNLEEEERARGNAAYKSGAFDLAVKSYTRCLGYNMTSVVAFSNRAMAYLKMKEWGSAERDADRAIAIDPTHVKSYQRRSAARVSLGKLRAALARHDEKKVTC